MSPRAVFMIDVSFEDVLDDFLSVMRVHLAFPSRGRHALREALEREKGLLVAGREQEVGRRIRGVNLPMDNRQFPRLCHLIEKGQAGVRYRFSVGRPSGEGSVRIVRIISDPSRPEPHSNHGHRNPREHETGCVKSEV